jgi:hypothetical protein
MMSSGLAVADLNGLPGSRIDFKSSEESEEDGIEIIITPKRKQHEQPVSSVAPSVASCNEHPERSHIPANHQQKHDSDTDNSYSSIDSNKQNLLSLMTEFTDRRDSGFSDGSARKDALKQVESEVSIAGNDDEGDAEAAEEAEGEEEEEDAFVVPDHDLIQKIVEQVRENSNIIRLSQWMLKIYPKVKDFRFNIHRFKNQNRYSKLPCGDHHCQTLLWKSALTDFK